MENPDNKPEILWSDKELGEDFIGDLAIFVNKNRDYYIRKWYMLAGSGEFLSWNWPAFFFQWAWLAYRKMYMYSIIYVCMQTLLPLLLPGLAFLVSLMIGVGCGVWGNYLYYHTAVNEVRTIREISDPEIRSRELLRRGGTSWVAVIAVWLLFFVFFLFLDSLAVIISRLF